VLACVPRGKEIGTHSCNEMLGCCLNAKYKAVIPSAYAKEITE
jgi:hypothetical protein